MRFQFRPRPSRLEIILVILALLAALGGFFFWRWQQENQGLTAEATAVPLPIIIDRHSELRLAYPQGETEALPPEVSPPIG